MLLHVTDLQKFTLQPKHYASKLTTSLTIRTSRHPVLGSLRKIKNPTSTHCTYSTTSPTNYSSELEAITNYDLAQPNSSPSCAQGQISAMTSNCNPLSAGPSSLRTTAITPQVQKLGDGLSGPAVDSEKKFPLNIHKFSLATQIQFGNKQNKQQVATNPTKLRASRFKFSSVRFGVNSCDAHVGSFLSVQRHVRLRLLDLEKKWKKKSFMKLFYVTMINRFK